jgi:release factor glutamine methyltransferase
MTKTDAAQLLRTATEQLKAHMIESARLDADILLSHVLGLSRTDMRMQVPTLVITDAQRQMFLELIARRMAHEPVAYLIGSREFWSLEFDVGPGVLIPRADSETLIETAQACFAKNADLRVLDLGTGPGTLLVTIAHIFPQATGLGIDCSDTAVDYARRNATKLGVAERVRFQTGNWLEGVTEHFDLLLCNPPYIDRAELPSLMADVADFEPHVALFAEEAGLAVYKHLLPRLATVLKPNGMALFELGHQQSGAIGQLAVQQGLECRLVPDLAGHLRCAVLTIGQG